MANSYVFRKIDGDLWRQARAKCLKHNVKFINLVEAYLREWLRMDFERGVDDVLKHVLAEVAENHEPPTR